MKYITLILIVIGFLFCFIAGIARENADPEMFRIALIGACCSYLFAFLFAYVAYIRATPK